ncbi:hypothetical protein DPEC_G00184850 [Dallia pectoralis]|uniref:Uncharacterized protein n=1 Tax=Dallia pectoralis TaxID=75939 RepID=A0ACC2GAY4_DALPE|nr:hypothetical protein DPEC_G00184850 [Dallia pectoralis]
MELGSPRILRLISFLASLSGVKHQDIAGRVVGRTTGAAGEVGRRVARGSVYPQLFLGTDRADLKEKPEVRLGEVVPQRVESGVGGRASLARIHSKDAVKPTLYWDLTPLCLSLGIREMDEFEDQRQTSH